MTTTSGPAAPRSVDVPDLAARRAGREQALAAVAAAPVRHLPPALLEALQGAWGTPEELGLTPSRPRLHLVAG